MKTVDQITVEVRSSKNEATPISVIPAVPANIDRNDNPTRDLLLQCTSVTEITDKLSGFSFDEVKSVVICNVCVTAEQAIQVRPGKLVHGIFAYDPAMDEDPLSNPEFNLDVQSDAFRNLKKHLRRHLAGVLQNSNLDDAATAEELKTKEERRECSVGMKIGKTCYYLFKKGRPDTDFPDLILLQSMNELDVGEINNSETFPAKFLPYVVQFLNNRLDQTGFRPVGKVVADNATYKHRTGQFVSSVIVVPNSTDLIHEPISAGSFKLRNTSHLCLKQLTWDKSLNISFLLLKGCNLIKVSMLMSFAVSFCFKARLNLPTIVRKSI